MTGFYRAAALSVGVIVAASACAASGSPQCGETLRQDGQHTPLYCAGPSHLPRILIAASTACALILAFWLVARYVRARGAITPARKATGRGGSAP
jgi:hypothetical protein